MKCSTADCVCNDGNCVDTLKMKMSGQQVWFSPTLRKYFSLIPMSLCFSNSVIQPTALIMEAIRCPVISLLLYQMKKNRKNKKRTVSIVTLTCLWLFNMLFELIHSKLSNFHTVIFLLNISCLTLLLHR